MRSVSYDWLHERDPVVGIERLDTPVRRERLPQKSPRPSSSRWSNSSSATARLW